jgi:hypothetical protein
MGRTRNAYRFGGKGALGKIGIPRKRWKNNIKMNRKEKWI